MLRKFPAVLGLFMITICCIFSCKHSSNPERQAIYDQVMEIHDEVMPEMSTINKLERQLKRKLETMESQDSIIMVKGTVKRLGEAGESMMDWMHQLDIPGSNVSDEEAIAYLKEEKLKISSVSSRMKTAIQSGKAIMEEK